MQGDRSMKLGIAFSFLFIFLFSFLVEAGRGSSVCPAGTKRNWLSNCVPDGSKPIVKAPAPPKICDTQGTKSCSTSAAEKAQREADTKAAIQMIGKQGEKNTDGPPAKPGIVKRKSGNKKSDPKPEAKPSPIEAAQTDVVKPVGETPFEVCIRGWYQQVESCESKAEDAVTRCDIDKSENEELNSAKKLGRKITGDEINKRQGSGQANECGLAALLGNTASMAIDQFKNSCEEIQADCVDSCKAVKEAIQSGAIEKECSEKISSASKLAEESELREHIEKIKSTYNEGDEKCSAIASEKKGIVEQTLSAIANSTQAAKICQCRLTASGPSGGFDPAMCEQGVPNPTDCLPGAALAGSPACNIYANDDCTLGSGKFNSIPCQCARDSSASVCRSVAGKPTPSNFAMDLKAGSVVVGAGGGFADGGDSGNLNLGGGYDIKKPQGELKPGEADAAGGGYASGGGGPGGAGSGSGGGNGEDPGALAEEDDGSNKGGLPGLFNQVRTSMGDLFGLKNKSGKTAGSRGVGGGRPAGYNIKDWIPRGVAGAGCQISQMRCKNEDIFSIMNQRYDKIETTFTDAP